MWECVLQPGTGPDGTQLVSVLGKRTYRFAPDGKVEIDLDHPIPIFRGQTFLGGKDPDKDPVLQDDDLVAWKPLVDVVVHGSAHAPRGKRGYFFDVGVMVGDKARLVRVFGNRRIDLSSGKLRFTEPEPFDDMPLHWGLAYGGADVLTDPSSRLVHPRNPVGKGFLVAPPLEALHGFALPNLENPNTVLTPQTLLLKKFDRWKTAQVPMALGWTSRHFHDRAAGDPRAKGTHPFLQAPSPNAAPAFLRLGRLAGNETITLGYMDPDHPRLSFALPNDIPRAYLDMGKREIRLPTFLQTVEFYPSSRQFTLLWRASVRVGREVSLEEALAGDGWMDSRPEKIVQPTKRPFDVSGSSQPTELTR